MILILNEEFNDETLLKVATALEQKNVTIYLRSGGGSADVGNALVHMINNHPNIKVIGFGILGSAAFDLFFKLQVPRELLPNTYGVAHLSSLSITILETGKPKKDEEFYYTSMRSELSKSIKFFTSLGLTTQELDVIKSGQDLFLTYKRLQQIYEDQLNRS